MALKEELNPKNLWGVDIDAKTIETAKNMGIIDDGFKDAKIPLENSDIVIVSLYPELAIDFIKSNIQNFKRGAVITDTSGIKGKVVGEISSCLPDYLDFIGGHPMAGREAKGLSYASKDIFKNANYILTPTEKNKSENLALIKNIALTIGCSNVVSVDPESHDKIIAYTSGLPHLIAVSLVSCNNFGNTQKSFIGGGFRDTTRIAEINPDLWSELFISNKNNIIEQIDKFQSNLSILKTAIENEDMIKIKEIFDSASKKRSELNSNE
ncbi:prephenate dehydrogenase [Clostridium acidisoli]|nr:prephenate dehydrogenase [Clostridium acidisoli]